LTVNKKPNSVFLFLSIVVSGILSDGCKREALPVLTTAEISNIAFTTAISGGNVSDEGSSLVKVRGVCWNTTTKPTVDDNQTTDSTGGGSFVSSMTGLVPNTRYLVRAYATNNAGTGYGLEISFNTQPTGLPIITTKDAILSIPDHYLTGGTIISDGGMAVTERGVCWSTHQSPTILDKKTSDSTGVGSFSSRIAGIERLTTYYVRAYATNSLGTAYGNQVSFTTPCIDFPGIGFSFETFSPINGATEQPINTTLNWSYLRPGTGTGVIFDVYFDTSPDPATKIATNLSSNKITLSELDAGTTYYWKVIGWEAFYPCNIAKSDILHFSTVKSTPSVSTTGVITYTSTSATIGGYVSAEGSASVTERGVYWGTFPNSESTGTKLQIGNGTGSFSTSLSGLIPNTIYYVKGYAINSFGIAYGSQVSFNTGLSTAIPTVSDIEGNVYQIVTIGTQVWMAENLKATRYRNGISIPLVTNKNAWNLQTTPRYCWYNNDEGTYKNTYGAMYNWYTVETGNLCPSGWHVPSDTEWTTLTSYLGGDNVASGKQKESGITHWASPNTEATNESGFTALPEGYCSENGTFGNIGGYGYWWSVTEYDSISVWGHYLYYGYNNRSRSLLNKNFGFSVRCLKD
jgi:uncharacterized protein (TIGR02145 family)